MASRRLDLGELVLELLIAARDRHELDRLFDAQEAVENLLDWADAEAAGKLQNDRAIRSQAVLGDARVAILGRTEGRVNRDAGGECVSSGDAPVLQVERAFLGRGEVAVAGRIDPEPMRLEIRRRYHLGQVDLSLLPERGDDFRGQKVRIDDEVPRLFLQELQERFEVELFEIEPQLVGALLGRTGQIEHVVEVAQDVRRLVDEVEVELPVNAFEETIRHVEDVNIAHGRIGQRLPGGQLDGLGGAQMAGADGRG